MSYKVGDQVVIRPEWQDPGDAAYVWVAVSDEEKGRVDISPLGTGLQIPPVHVVRTDMLAPQAERD